MRRFAAFFLIFSIIISISYTTAYASHALSNRELASGVINRFFDMIVDSARVYLSVTDEIAPVSLTFPDILLINADNPVPRYFHPESMIDISVYVSTTRSPLLLEEEAASAYINMVASMAEYGIRDLAAISGFRDYEHQTRIHEAEVARQSRHFPRDEARRRAAMIVAAPGTSEHQSGLAIDVSSAEVGFSLSARFENTIAFAWLSENAHKYGFIIRYPRDSTEITGVIFEPWHLRYVGVDHAARIFESGITLEEYMDMYLLGAWSE